MTRDEAVARIQRRLGFRGDLTEEIVQSLRDSQDELENGAFMPWFLWKQGSLTTVAGSYTVPLPADFIREDEEGGLFYFIAGAGDTWRELVKGAVDEILRAYGGEGEPKAYALQGTNVQIAPVPNAEYALRLHYFARDATLATNIENLWLKYAPFLLIGEAGMKVAMDLRDADALRYFESIAQREMARIVRATTARFSANRRAVMGGVD